MDFLDDQYGKISTIEDLTAKDNMTLAFTVPTSSANIQEAIDAIEGRYTKHVNQYMPTITDETKEVLKIGFTTVLSIQYPITLILR